MYKYILFDLDGTLTNSKEGITKSVQYALNKFNISVQDLNSLEKFIGPPLKDSFMEYYDFDENKADEAVKYYREYFSEKGLFENEIYPNIESMLSKLKDAGLHLIVATSKPTVFSEKILDHFNLAKFFDAIVGSTLDGSRSKKSDVIKFVLKKNKINPNEALMIGDREHDIIGAAKNNITSMGVTYGFGSHSELKKAGAAYVVDTVNEIAEKIISLNKRNIFVIGDSVSIHYGPFLNKMIKDKFNYDRKRGIDQALVDLDTPVGANAGDSRMVLSYLQEECKKNTKYDVLLLNCGLHDIRVNRETNEIQVGIEEYQENLIEIIKLSKTMSNKFIWVGLTPIIDKIHNSRKEGFLRHSRDAENYNNAALQIMKEYDVPCIDMYNFTKNLGEDIYFDHVHYKEEIRKLQAAFIAGYLDCIL
ncbi:hypothetical protein AGR56_10145 [Clostridium sp. DMHC 10]|nr:hypothetical protein AGR56_10145 [Clostridium sp. DMHC 10]